MASVSPPQQNTPESPAGDSPATNNSNETRSAESKEAQAAAEKRVRLACHRCRAKRARCSGDRPICRACEKANEECTWPSGRKRKRTRREMEADERRERESAASAAMAEHGMFAPPKPMHEQNNLWVRGGLRVVLLRLIRGLLYRTCPKRHHPSCITEGGRHQSATTMHGSSPHLCRSPHTFGPHRMVNIAKAPIRPPLAL